MDGGYHHCDLDDGAEGTVGAEIFAFLERRVDGRGVDQMRGGRR